MATSGVPSSTEQAGRRLGVWSLLMVPAVLLSGFATPIENMPDWLQPVRGAARAGARLK